MQRHASVLGILLLASGCASAATDASASGEAAIEGATSDSQLFPALSVDAANARARTFERQNPGFRVVDVGQVTGSITYAYRPSTPAAPVALTPAEAVTRARAFLLANAELLGVRPEELIDHPDEGVASQPRSFVHDYPAFTEVAFYAPARFAGFEDLTSLTGKVAFVVDLRGGEPVEVRTDPDGPPGTDPRGLPLGAKITVSRQPRLAPTDPAVVAHVLGRTPPGYSPIVASDIASIEPTIHVGESVAGARVTTGYRIAVDKKRPAGSNETFYFIVDGASGAVLSTADVHALYASDKVDTHCHSLVPLPGAVESCD